MKTKLVARKFCGFTHYSVSRAREDGIEWEVAHLSYAAEFPDWADDAYGLVNSLSFGASQSPAFN